MQNNVETAQFRPELLPRRGEWIAWGLALVAGASWVFLSVSGAPGHWSLPFMAIVLFLAAAGVSLSNWIERHTLIRLDSHGIGYENGLRKVQILWGEVRGVSVFDTLWGKKVQVFGNQTHFVFNTLGVLSGKNGQVQGRTGFVEGEKILAQIIGTAGLKPLSYEGKGNYYARE